MKNPLSQKMLISLVSVLWFCFVCPLTNALEYRVTDLGIGDDFSVAYNINNHDQVVGSSGLGQDNRAILWEKCKKETWDLLVVQ